MKKAEIITKAPPLETVIGPEAESIETAVKAWNSALLDFVSPKILERSGLRFLSQIHDVVRQRLDDAAVLAQSVIEEINERTRLLHRPEVQSLIERERELWARDYALHLSVGARTCVDAGIPSEAILGIDSQESVGRSLAGDDQLLFDPFNNEFLLDPSTLKKKLIHSGRLGDVIGLEFLIEHTGCGRRGQMLANFDNKRIAGLFHEVEMHADAFANDDNKMLEMITPEWSKKNTDGTLKMGKDGGIWMGVLSKMAQRQAYENLKNKKMVVPIEVYDKFTGNALVGFDNLRVLTHEAVINAGGFTQEVIDQLVEEGLLFSLRHEIENLEANYPKVLGSVQEYKGKWEFDDLKEHWLEVNTSIVDVVSELWKKYENDDSDNNELRKMVLGYVEKALASLRDRLDMIVKDDPDMQDAITLIERRIIHHLFRELSYSWVLDTFGHGHPPGQHIEDHLAIGDSGVLGVKRHIPLGQGDIQIPTAQDVMTGRSVLLHSVPGKEGAPIVLFIKNDTLRPDNKSMSDEENKATMTEFEEVLKLWPYIMVGDIVPYIVIRGKQRNSEITRIGLSVLIGYENLVLLRYANRLGDLVPAVNSKGEVVVVSADLVLAAGIEADKDLVAFRRLVQEKADLVSDPVIQKALRAHYEA